MDTAYGTLNHKTTGYTFVLSSLHRTFTKTDHRRDNKTGRIFLKRWGGP